MPQQLADIAETSMDDGDEESDSEAENIASDLDYPNGDTSESDDD